MVAYVYNFEVYALFYSICEVLDVAYLDDWADDDSNNQRRINIHSGKSLSLYSLLHTRISMRLNPAYKFQSLLLTLAPA